MVVSRGRWEGEQGYCLIGTVSDLEDESSGDLFHNNVNMLYTVHFELYT